MGLRFKLFLLRGLAVMICCANAFFVHSQSSYIKSFGDINDQEAFIVLTGDDIFATGIHGSNPSFFLSKLDDNLVPIWSKNYASNSSLHRDFVKLPDGNFLMSGLENNNFSTSLIKVDIDGHLLLAKKFGSFADRLKNLHVSTGGFIYHSGELEGLVSGRNKPTVQKMNTNLEVQWGFYLNYEGVETNTSSSEAYERDLIELSDGSFMMLFTYSSLDGTNRKIRVAKFNSSGVIDWVKGYNGGVYDLPQRMVKSNADDVFIISSSSSFSSSKNLLLTKIDGDGNHQWSKIYDYESDQDPTRIIIDSDNQLIITGNSTNGKLFWVGVDLSGVLNFAYELDIDQEAKASNIIEFDGGYLISGSIVSKDGDKDILALKINDNGELSVDCSKDILSSISTNSVNLTTVNLSYTKSSLTVNSPSTPAVNTLNYVKQDVSCDECPTPEQIETSICAGEFLEFDYSEYGSTIQWNDGSKLQTRQLYDADDYWIEYTKDGCTVRDQITIEHRPEVPSFSLGSDTTFCGQGSISSNVSFNPVFSLDWNTESDVQSISVVEPGKYWLKVSGECNSQADTINVGIVAPISYSQIADTLLCNVNEYELEFPAEYNYSWSTGSSSSVESINDSGNYWVEISNECETVLEEFEINFSNTTDILIPNAFSPNEDGINDSFLLPNDLSGADLKVVDRKGTVLFESTNYQNNWKADQLESGIYYLIISHICLERNIKGNLNVLR